DVLPSGGAATVPTMRVVVVLLAAVVAAAGVVVVMSGGDDSATSSSAHPTVDVVACDTLPGRPADEVRGGCWCTGAVGRIVVLVWTERACSAGRVVVWADQGWGYRGHAWQPHGRPDGQLVPPDDVLATCQG